MDVQHGLTEEAVATLLLHDQQATLDGPDAGRTDIAVLGGVLPRMLAHVG